MSTLILDSKLNGFLYTNESSKKIDADILIFKDGKIKLTYSGNKKEYLLSETKITNRIGNIPRTLTFKDGFQFETLENDKLDAIINSTGKMGKSYFLHILESKKSYLLISLLVLVIIIWLSISFLIPKISKVIAFSLPPKILNHLSKQTAEILDKTMLTKTELTIKEQNETKKSLNIILKNIKNNDYNIQLHFRKGNNLGANAFALPNGVIIITDELVQLSDRPEEITAVLAHETGHIIQRHGLRTVIQNSFASMIIIVVTADILSYSSIAAALPAVLIKNGYSRDFEREADMYAYHFLKDNNIDTKNFINILNKLENSHKIKNKNNLLSTHPSTKERIKLFLKSDK